MTSPLSTALRMLSVLIADQDASTRYSLPMVAAFVSLADAHPDRLTVDEIGGKSGLNRESVVRALGGLGEYAKQRAASPLFLVNEHLTAGGMQTFGLNDAGLAMRQQMLTAAGDVRDAAGP